MQPYEVVYEFVGYFSIRVRAESAAEAVKLAKDIEFDASELHFDDAGLGIIDVIQTHEEH